MNRYLYRFSVAALRLCMAGMLTILAAMASKAQSPEISSFNPASAGQSVPVTIKGHFFTTATAVTFGGSDASFFYASSDTTIVAYVGLGSSGPVAVTNPSGTDSLVGFTFIFPPVLTALIPSSGGFGDTILIKGNHFTGVSNVYIGDSAVQSFTVLSDSLIRFIAGNGNSELVTVSTIGGEGSITGFNHNGPIIYSFTPTRGNAGTNILIRGKHFTLATLVSFGGFSASGYTVNSDSLITATIGAGGPGDVLVKTAKGTHAIPGFILPTITSFEPQYGTKTDTILLRGKNFNGTSSVFFGDSAAASFQVVSDTLIRAVLGNGGSGAVRVTTPGNTATAYYFVYLPFRPQIHSFSPGIAENGVTVSIRGKYFTGTSAVRFGNTAALSFEVLSDTSINAVVGDGGTGHVYVTNAGVTDSLEGFIYTIAQPRIDSFSPASGTIGSAVVISGSGFSPAIQNNTVYFGAVKAVVNTASTTTLSVTVPASATYQPISVTKSGLTAWSAKPFHVLFPGAMAGFSNASFETQIKLATPGNSPQRITAGDFNGDGKIDIAVANGTAGSQNSSVAVYRNNSNNGIISFAAPVQFSLGSVNGNGFDIATADMNGDGKPDLVSMSYSDNIVSVLPNSGTGSSIAFASRVNAIIGTSTGGTATNPVGISLGDFDLDGKADISAANYHPVNPCKASWIKNLTTGTGIPVLSSRTDFTVPNAGGVYTADLNADRQPDIAVGIDVTTGSNLKQVSLLNNTSSTPGISFVANPDVGAANTLKTAQIAFADLDADGRIDMVTANSNANSISIFRNTSGAAGVISFATPANINIGSGARGISIADLDGDGKPDIAATSADSNWVSVLKNTSTTGNIILAPGVPYPTGKSPQRLVCADLDSDGKPEMIVANQGDSSISIIKNVIGEPLKLCPPTASTSISSNLSGSSYRWQVSTNNGTTFINLNNTANYAGVTTRTLQLINLPATATGNMYRCVVNGTNSNAQTIQFISYWTGAVSSAWATAGNWSCGQVPDAFTDVVIKSGAAILFSNGICRSIRVLPGARCTVNTGAGLTVAH